MKKTDIKETDIVPVHTAVKETGRGGRYNFPNTIKPEPAEDVRAALSTVVRWYDAGLSKAVTLQDWVDRTRLFFSTCLDEGERPTWEKYCLCVGYPRQMVWDFAHGNRGISPEISDVIKRAKDYCAAFDAEMVSAGKMRDAPYIFRAVNYYGLKQAQDITIEARPQRITEETAEEVAAKWAALPED